MADLERRQAELVVSDDDVARPDGVEADVDGWPVPGEDDLEQQVVDACQRRPPAVDVDMVQVLPAGQGRDQPAQPQDVVEVAV